EGAAPSVSFLDASRYPPFDGRRSCGPLSECASGAPNASALEVKLALEQCRLRAATSVEERTMKRRRNFQSAIGIAALVFGLSAGAEVALAQVLGNPEVVQPNSNEFGNTYGEWSARWVQWLFSIPEDKNPALDSTGANCDVGQTGQVWFLAGTFGDPAVRKCTIPSGQDLLFP